MAYTYKHGPTPGVFLRSDGASIPADPGNLDYQELQRMMDEGYEPEAYDPPPKRQTRDERIVARLAQGKAAIQAAGTLAEVKSVMAATLDGLGQVFTGD